MAIEYEFRWMLCRDDPYQRMKLQYRKAFTQSEDYRTEWATVPVEEVDKEEYNNAKTR